MVAQPAPAPTPAAEALHPIKFLDLDSQKARIRERVENGLSAALDHGAFIAGPEIGELESRLTAWTGAAACVAVSSGTDALIMALLAKGVKPGDAVLLPAFTYNASANAVLLAGAVPVFVDIDPATFTLCADDLQRRIAAARRQGLHPTTVMTVDLYGMPADYAAIEAICAREGLTILADAAQSFGGEVNGRRVGALAPMTATSFYPSKTLGCYGDGGAIFITDADMVDVLASLRWHGTNAGKKVSERVGLNGRLDTFQAVVLNAKLDIFDEERARRRIIAELYDECFQDTVRRQKAPAGAVSAHGLYTVAVEERDTVRAHLAEHGIPSAVYYEHPLHTMPAFAAYAPDPLPGAEWAARRVLSLPMHPYLSEAQARFVAETLLQAVSR